MAVSFIGSSGCSAAATNGGSATATFATAPSAGDLIIALSVIGSTRTTGGTVTSSSGILYNLETSLTSSNGLLVGEIWTRRSTGEGNTTVVCSGTGASSDATAIAAFVFRGVGYYDSITSTNGASSQPNSPAVTSKYNGDAIISAVAVAANSAAAVTAPSCSGSSATTFLNLISTGATDNRLCQLGMSWFASTGSGKSYNPNSYSSFNTGSWVSFTVQLGSTEDPGTYFDRGSLEVPAAYQVEPGLSAAWAQYVSGITVPSAAAVVTWSQTGYWPDFAGGDRELRGMIGY